jgi:hypothetical protein
MSRTWLDLVREVFPDATDEEAGTLLWEQTGFPSFWNIPRDGATPEECCRTQLERFKTLLAEEGESDGRP